MGSGSVSGSARQRRKLKSLSRKPVFSVTEWSELTLPPALNHMAVKQRLIAAGSSHLGNAVRLVRGRVYASGLAGLISTPDLHLQILPKVTEDANPERGLKLLKDMLRLEPKFGGHAQRDTIGATNEDLLEFIIGRIASAVASQLESGPPRRYFPAVEDLSTIRGRVDLNYQAQVAPGSALNIRVRHAPLQRDNHLSRLIRAVLLLLLEDTKSVAHRSSLLNCLDYLAGVEEMALTPALIDLAEANQFESEWVWIIDLARQLVGGQSPDSVRGGKTKGFSLLFSLHGLFERTLRDRLSRSLSGELRLRATKSLGRLLSVPATGVELLGLEPDFIIDRQGKLTVIGDAKWRRAALGDVLRQDAYQLVTYMTRSGIPKGFLCYPSMASLPSICALETFEIKGAAAHLYVLRLDAEGLCSAKQPDIKKACDALHSMIEQMLD